MGKVKRWKETDKYPANAGIGLGGDGGVGKLGTRDHHTMSDLKKWNTGTQGAEKRRKGGKVRVGGRNK